jgi:hypothetical protein
MDWYSLAWRGFFFLHFWTMRFVSGPLMFRLVGIEVCMGRLWGEYDRMRLGRGELGDAWWNRSKVDKKKLFSTFVSKM